MDYKIDNLLEKLDTMEARLSMLENRCIDKSFPNQVNQSITEEQQDGRENMKESPAQDIMNFSLMKLAESLQEINITMVNQALAIWNKKNKEGKHIF